MRLSGITWRSVNMTSNVATQHRQNHSNYKDFFVNIFHENVRERVPDRGCKGIVGHMTL